MTSNEEFNEETTSAASAEEATSTEPEATPEEVAEETVEETSPETSEEIDPLLEAQAQIIDLEDQVARARAETYNVQQQYNGYVRRSKTEQAEAKNAGVASVLTNLMSVLDDIELARQHDDLDGPAGSIALKLENVLKTNHGLERFGAEGDPFDPTIHEALMHSVGEVETEQIGTLIQPGYKIGDKIIRPARVGVVSPE